MKKQLVNNSKVFACMANLLGKEKRTQLVFIRFSCGIQAKSSFWGGVFLGRPCGRSV
jgi:hypothetical protein